VHSDGGAHRQTPRPRDINAACGVGANTMLVENDEFLTVSAVCQRSIGVYLDHGEPHRSLMAERW
jgi:hypothetical protein